tara:strand:+ start:162 stop:326 length:165 start_codon:yes stop_codon:yes gene_type:complete
MTKRTEKEILAAFTHMATELNGTIQHLTTYNSKGTTSKKIVIEYDVEEKERINI